MSGPVVVRRQGVARVRHDVRFRLLEVADAVRVTPRLVRLTLAGAQVQGFASAGFDDHVKVFFPPAGAAFNRLPSLGPDGPLFDRGATRPVATRDYTPHDYDPAALTLRLDFTLYGAPAHPGPATAWARRARRGDTLIVGGPRSSSVVAADVDWHLLVGDETALPAIRRRLRELPAGARAVVCAQVNGSDDEEPFQSRAHVQVHWVHRTRGASQASLLVAADAAARRLSGDGHAWVAGESSIANGIPTALLARGVNRAALRAFGYWRRSAPSTYEVLEEGGT